MSIIQTLRKNNSSTDTAAVGLIHGYENEFVDRLRNEGKLVVQDEPEVDDSDEGTGLPQPAPPARKKQRTANGAGNYSKKPPSPRPSLPLASRNHAGPHHHRNRSLDECDKPGQLQFSVGVALNHQLGKCAHTSMAVALFLSLVDTRLLWAILCST